MSKYYTYYMASTEFSSALLKEHEETVDKPRKDIIANALNRFDAFGLSTSSNWTGPASITGLTVREGHPMLKEKHVIVKHTFHEDDGVYLAIRGRANMKAGKQLNADIGVINNDLKQYPPFTDWIIQKLDIMKSGLGGPSPTGRGTSMIETNGGFAGEHLVFQIPVDGRDVELPSELTEITYGQFYDMAES